MNSIALICKFSWVGVSTSVINTAIFWESRGYFVDLYCENPDITQFPLPEFPQKNIKYIITHFKKENLYYDFYFRKHCYHNIAYEFVIGFDYTGLIRAGIASFGKNTKLIYHSLEFFEPVEKKIKNLYMKFLERMFSKIASYIFTQDQYRISFLAKDLHLPNTKFKIIFNSPIGKHIKGFSKYFHDLFNISTDKKIVLCTGSLIEEHFVKELLLSVNSWDNRFVLILHGWFPNIDIRQLVLKKRELHPNKIYISDKLFSDCEKYVPFLACDIGFVGFKPFNNNLKYAAGSAGKLFDFLRTGKPIIAFDTPGMRDMVHNISGIVFSDPIEISNSLNSILTNYNQFSRNCHNQYYNFEFSKQYDNVLEEIQS
jgi:glycosyltransferase involved in cell wall biosynthesis